MARVKPCDEDEETLEFIACARTAILPNRESRRHILLTHSPRDNDELTNWIGSIAARSIAECERVLRWFFSRGFITREFDFVTNSPEFIHAFLNVAPAGFIDFDSKRETPLRIPSDFNPARHGSPLRRIVLSKHKGNGVLQRVAGLSLPHGPEFKAALRDVCEHVYFCDTPTVRVLLDYAYEDGSGLCLFHFSDLEAALSSSLTFAEAHFSLAVDRIKAVRAEIRAASERQHVYRNGILATLCSVLDTCFGGFSIHCSVLVANFVVFPSL